MNYKKYFIFVILVVLLGLAACDPRAPGREIPGSNVTPSSSGSERSVAGDPNANYMEMRDGEVIDADFNGSASELFYGAYDDNGQVGHQFGQNVSQGSGIGLSPATSVPDYTACYEAVKSTHPGHAFELDDIFCFKTWDGNIGYLHVIKLTEEQVNSVTTWTVGFNYHVWGP
ncbi:MAG: hypothetical protein HN855_15645 [Anaerolineae bacterium]|jgi:hypothetical protein|nr:hypothetical protein [Anaerolineae bacterium]MBT7072414.1 hypothetical protein [Anaerolineae bacterium]MBT7326589.1 hypothetical protein [Anaerolineae bacterium]